MSRKMDVPFDEEYKPLIINASDGDSGRILERLQQDSSLRIHDEIKSQIGDLIKLRNPHRKYSADELGEAIIGFFGSQSPEKYGNWVYYPWRNCLVHLLPKDEFVSVRTIRNKHKITDEEQRTLETKKIGVIGLSVGQSVALTLALERGCGELRLADFDTLELSNLNRIRTGVYNIGIKKSILVAREIAEIDPYLNIVLYNEGIHEGNMDDFFRRDGQLDLLIEECDSLEMKIKSRVKAKELKIPVIMDTSDRGMIDVERFDLEPDRPIFHGMLSKFGEESQLLENLDENRNQLLMSILDFEKLSERAKFSIGEMGKSITTWPQLASSVVMGGAMVAYFAKNILCAQTSYSGRMYVDLDELLIAEHESKN
ncbi:ThiF family adenylyltransferase [Algoriphagus resistens]|uniref:ThiF family adenylyltransferase n=1 Tax=Algoriphagus resistens TaxID=1750590 RepID=UPI000716AA21|nr:ThiF family adenylyltransferase [Algoriphagus resistens]